jgi:hypothetical protein
LPADKNIRFKRATQSKKSNAVANQHDLVNTYLFFSMQFRWLCGATKTNKKSKMMVIFAIINDTKVLNDKLINESKIYLITPEQS